MSDEKLREKMVRSRGKEPQRQLAMYLTFKASGTKDDRVKDSRLRCDKIVKNEQNTVINVKPQDTILINYNTQFTYTK